MSACDRPPLVSHCRHVGFGAIKEEICSNLFRNASYAKLVVRSSLSRLSSGCIWPVLYHRRLIDAQICLGFMVAHSGIRQPFTECFMKMLGYHNGRSTALRIVLSPSRKIPLRTYVLRFFTHIKHHSQQLRS